MRCPNCGARNPSENRMCVKCAQPLTSEGAQGSPFSNAPVASTPPVARDVSSAPPSTWDAPEAPSQVSLQKPAASEAAPTSAGAAAAPVAAADGVMYKPSGRVGPGTVPVLALAAVVGGLFAGWLYHMIAPHMNLLLVSQLYVGFIAGGAVALAAKKAKVRRPRLAIALAAMAGLLAYGTFEGLNSMRARAEYVDYVAQSISQQGNAAQARALAETAVPSQARFFPLYMQALGASGTTLQSSHAGSTSKTGISVSGPWYWALLCAEIGIVVLVSGGLAQAAASAPFCERCDGWYKKSTVHKTHVEQAPAMLERVQAGRWDAVREVPVLSSKNKKPDDKNHADVVLTHCSGCSDGWAALTCTVQNGAKTLAQSRLDTQTVAVLAAGAGKK